MELRDWGLFRERGNSGRPNEVGARMAHYASELVLSHQHNGWTACASGYAGSALSANGWVVSWRSRSNLHSEYLVDFGLAQDKVGSHHQGIMSWC